jgi:ParB/RepB/Spo0J family partition protein
MSTVSLGFLPEPKTLPLSAIAPSHQQPAGLIETRKFRQIVASIQAVGLIEPLSVTPKDKETGKYLLLDGHTRLVALTQLGYDNAPCLIATDDESYTYNNRVNRLNSVQEHLMIQRMVKQGKVTPAKIAEALDVEVKNVHRKLNLLEGICPEAIELLKDQHFTFHLSAVLRKMKPTRQVECLELMLSSNNLTVSFAKAMLVSTPANLLVGETKPKKMEGVTAEQMMKMEREMDNLHEQFKLVEQSYSQDMLNLVLARGYLDKLLGNEAVFRFLSQRHPDMLTEFGGIVQATSLDK